MTSVVGRDLPNVIPNEMWTDIPGHPRTFYSRFARCKRCGLSAAVAGEFGDYGSEATIRRRGSVTNAGTHTPDTNSSIRGT